jgi:hypothetical protein
MDRGETLTAGKPTAAGGFCYDNLGNNNGNGNCNCTVTRHGKKTTRNGTARYTIGAWLSPDAYCVHVNQHMA